MVGKYFLNYGLRCTIIELSLYSSGLSETLKLLMANAIKQKKPQIKSAAFKCFD